MKLLRKTKTKTLFLIIGDSNKSQRFDLLAMLGKYGVLHTRYIIIAKGQTKNCLSIIILQEHVYIIVLTTARGNSSHAHCDNSVNLQIMLFIRCPKLSIIIVIN